MKASDRIALQLRVASWRELFHVLHEVGLGTQPAARAKWYRLEYGMDFSNGPFWAIVQQLEAQIEACGVDPKTWRDPRRIGDET